MSKKYKSNEDIRALVSSFQNATIDRTEWKHPEHLVVALYYVSHHDFETATAKMRDGIYNLLTKGFNVDLEKETPYHETLTVFWMRTVLAFKLTANGSSLFEKANDLVANFDKDYPLRFYSHERLFSDEARATFVESDLNFSE
ncbi:MAG: hypothetical protein LC730_02315 [Acidobacteria bacterium]|nr:hypothetical protein [Acidobacteriota bacterium]MCA1608276.1 hypothetical protein [Acidobacteriota bacterium]